jgi:CubicO group peptidase (beta-lactamase class C family)
MRKRIKDYPTKTTGFLAVGMLLVAGIMISCAKAKQQDPLDEFFKEKLNSTPLAGVAACIIKDGKVVWSKGYGWADIEKKIPMSPDKVQNIGSISKTFTATAVMQLWEKGFFKLDDDVNDYLPFAIKHPRYPEETITFRQLLSHRSAIKDGPAYDESYACGDPTISLETWVKEYLTPGGQYYDEKENFHSWKPGEEGEIPAEPRAYTNVGFGLLGYLVERISGEQFDEYTKAHIFEPLAMHESAWFIRDINIENHSIPYTYIPESFKPDEGMIVASLPVAYPKRILLTLLDKDSPMKKGSFCPHCLYSFPNYPDGLVRTSLNQQARYLTAYINNGIYEGRRILKDETVKLMLSDQHFGRGLCWNSYDFDKKGKLWGHGGNDPGVNTLMLFRETDKVGVIVFTNTNLVRTTLFEIVKRLLEEADRL